MSEAHEITTYSFRDYLRFPPDERVELVDGIAFAMAPAPMRRHQHIVTQLTAELADCLREDACEVYVAPFDVKLSADEADDAPTVLQPDITVVCDSEKLTERGMTGPPDLVVEVVSPESGMHDRGRKYQLYRRFGVAEYWIVDPVEKVVEVHRLSDGRYDRIGVFGPDDELVAGAVPAIKVDLGRVFEG